MPMRILDRRIAVTHNKARSASSLSRGIQLAHHIGKENHFGGIDT